MFVFAAQEQCASSYITPGEFLRMAKAAWGRRKNMGRSVY